MKKLLGILTLAASVFVSCGPMVAHASLFPPNYFRFIGPGNYHVYDGALFSSHKASPLAENVMAIPLVTHSTADGSLLPKSWVDAGYAENWAPVVLGGNVGGGDGVAFVGSVVDFGPPAQRMLANSLHYLVPNKFYGLKALLIPSPADSVHITIGIMPTAHFLEKGTFMPINQWFKDPARYFLGGKFTW